MTMSTVSSEFNRIDNIYIYIEDNHTLQRRSRHRFDAVFSLEKKKKSFKRTHPFPQKICSYFYSSYVHTGSANRNTRKVSRFGRVYGIPHSVTVVLAEEKLILF